MVRRLPWLLLLLTAACTPRGVAPPAPTPKTTASSAPTVATTPTRVATTPIARATSATPSPTPSGTPLDESVSDEEVLTWDIQPVCIPIARPTDPKGLRSLPDGTVLYSRNDGTMFRGTGNRCRCLPPDTMIATPSGDIRIDELYQGDLVWTENAEGKRIAEKIETVLISDVPADHQVVQISLDDGRAIAASPLHPLPGGKTFRDLTGGDIVDGAKVVGTGMAPFDGRQTRDIRPAGPTGFYWANGVKVASTIPADTGAIVRQTLAPAPTPPSSDAEELLVRAEVVFGTYTSLEVRGGDAKRQLRALKLKIKQFQDVIAAFDRVAKIGDAESTVTARTRQGQACDHLADTLLSFSPPEGLTPEQGEIFTRELTRQAAPFREKGAAYYRQAVHVADERGISSVDERHARDRLRALTPTTP